MYPMHWAWFERQLQKPTNESTEGGAFMMPSTLSPLSITDTPPPGPGPVVNNSAGFWSPFSIPNTKRKAWEKKNDWGPKKGAMSKNVKPYKSPAEIDYDKRGRDGGDPGNAAENEPEFYNLASRPTPDSNGRR
jgi:hypothetical protein